MKRNKKKYLLALLVAILGLVFLGVYYAASIGLLTKEDENPNLEYDGATIIEKNNNNYLLVSREGKWYEVDSNKDKNKLIIAGNIDNELYYVNDNIIKSINAKSEKLKEKTVLKVKRNVGNAKLYGTMIYISLQNTGNNYSIYQVDPKKLLPKTESVIKNSESNFTLSNDKLYYTVVDQNKTLYEYNLNNKKVKEKAKEICNYIIAFDNLFITRSIESKKSCEGNTNLYEEGDNDFVYLAQGSIFRPTDESLYYLKDNILYTISHGEQYTLYKFDKKYQIEDFGVLDDNQIVLKTKQGQLLLKDDVLYTKDIEKYLEINSEEVIMKNGKKDKIKQQIFDIE